ncbi:ATPase [Hahella sp. CCB-MM4]|uniref:ATPase n=1 Tax=Hahella sp. (strain CCB-MM4) TaxID=1926491 RepID=UPI000B9B0B0C|nr:ATPase [Hahella sp. CCB-MM4]OZG69772.1 ATPase [Hahella sp. CCB-MM4]
MQVETLKDVLHWTTRFHQDLSQCMVRGAGHSGNERAKLLLDYLSKHETSLKRIVEEYEQSSNKNALDTWCYEYLEKHPVVRHEHCEVPFDELDSVQIMEVVMEYHRQVIELYRYLLAKAPTGPTQELLSSLLELEEHEVMIMAQGANRLEDL